VGGGQCVKEEGGGCMVCRGVHGENVEGELGMHEVGQGGGGRSLYC
jgi:hypothetical protein